MSSVAASAIMSNGNGVQAQAQPADPTAAASSVAAASASASAGAATNVAIGAPHAPSLWSRIRSVWIPTSAQRLADAEAATLAAIRGPFESRMVAIAPDPALGGPDWEINTITLRNPAAAASLPRSDDEAEPAPLVLLHGFGAGNGLWMSNFNLLAHHFPETHAVDMIGWGRSSRVDFEKLLSIKMKTGKIKKRSVSSKDKAAVAAAESEFRRAVATIAEDFTVDSLERWRVQMGLERMTLVGHSMGGYLAASYALKYPGRVSSLILASPIGVPHAKPIDTSRWGWTARQVLSLARAAWWGANITPQSVVRALGRWGPRPVSGYVTRRFVSDEERAARGPEGARGAAIAQAKQDEADKQAAAAKAAGTAAPAAPIVAANPTAASEDSAVDAGSIDVTLASDSQLSNAHSSPAAAANGANAEGADGGPALEVDDTLHAAERLGDYVAAHPAAFDKAVVAEYLYHICAQPGSGEFAFAKLFDESGFAHKPLIESLPAISRAAAPPAPDSASAPPAASSPSSSSSSSSSAAAAAAAPPPASHRVPVTFLYGTSDWMDVDAGMATTRAIRAQGGLAQCLLVSNAGHQLFIDNPKGFMEVLRQGYALGKK